MNARSRESMVRSAALLIGAQGLTATSFSEVLADSGAPRGSIYHHFPDGKRQLARDAIDWISGEILAYLEAEPPASPAAVLDRFVALWRRSVLASPGAAGCPVTGVLIDSGTSDPALTAAGRDAFRAWTGLLARQFETAGLLGGQAASLALTTLAALEGALILCRAEGGPGPLDVIAAELARLLPPG